MLSPQWDRSGNRFQGPDEILLASIREAVDLSIANSDRFTLSATWANIETLYDDQWRKTRGAIPLPRHSIRQLKRFVRSMPWKETMKLRLDGRTARAITRTAVYRNTAYALWECVEMDATVVDILIRDEEGNEIGRPVLYVAIDVASGYIVGLYGFYRPHSKRALSNAGAYLSTTGTSIWSALHAGVDHKTRLTIEHFDDQYGVAAFNQIRHRVMAGDEGSIKGSSVTPFTTAADGVTLNAHASRSKATPTSLVVITEDIPEATSTEDRATIKRYAALCCPQPVARMPSADWLIEREKRLLDEFPWASRVVRGIFQDLIARRYCGVTEVGIRPILILGAPGIGKTRLARRIAEELSMPFMPLNLAGMDDSRMILGTARGWSSGQPSPLLDVLLRNGNLAVELRLTLANMRSAVLELVLASSARW